MTPPILKKRTLMKPLSRHKLNKIRPIQSKKQRGMKRNTIRRKESPSKVN